MKIGRMLSVWLLIVLAETLHGVLRQLLLVEWLGDFKARQIGVVTGSLLILLITTLTIPWLHAPRPKQQFTIGLCWVVLMVVFEVSLGLFLHYPMARILEDYDLTQGGLMGAGLLVLLCAPYLASKVRQRMLKPPNTAV